MTPAEFNNLPLEQQLKQLQLGDELHPRGGGWMPFKGYSNEGGVTHILSYDTIWSDRGIFWEKAPTEWGIIRVIRPTLAKVPEIVDQLRQFNAYDYECPATALATILADHFEREAKS